MLISCWGLGNSCFIKSPCKDSFSQFTKLSIGLTLMSSLIYIFGLLQLYDTFYLWFIYSSGLTTFLLPSVRREIFSIKTFQSFSKNWVAGIVIVPYLIVTAIRTLSPTYFIDTCKYHFMICSVFLENKGISFNPENFLFDSHTSFFGESFYLIHLGLFDEFSAQLFVWCFAILCLYRLKSIVNIFCPKSNGIITFLLVSGNMVFTSVVIYSKTDVVMLYFVLELVYLALSNLKNIHTKIFAWLFSFTLMLKFNLVLFFPFLFLWCLYASYKNNLWKQQLINFLPGLFFPLLWMLKNMMTHGILMFPFVMNSPELPDMLIGGLKSPVDFQVRLKDSILNLFTVTTSFRFHAGLLLWLTIALVLIKKYYKIKKLQFWLTVSIIFWFFNIYLLPMHVAVMRVTLPLWVLGVIVVEKYYSEKGNRVLKIFISCLVIAQFLYTMKYCASFMPGKDYHLGKISLQKTYQTMGDDFGQFGSSLETDKSLDQTKKMAIFSEFGYLCRYPNRLYIHWSKTFDSHSWEYEKINKTFDDNKISYVLFDNRLSNPKNIIDQWIEKSLNNEKLVLIKKSRYAMLYQRQ